MSLGLDAILVAPCTRFRIFPQPRFLKAFSEPETIRDDVLANVIQQGLPHHVFRY
jgi:hypothetical protein